MSARRPTATTAQVLRQCLAGAGVALLLLLSLASASPGLHQWLHGDAAPDAGDQCAVVLFAGGIVLAAAAVAVAAPRVAWQVAPAWTAAGIFLTAPRYLRQPERGPPGC